MHVVIWALWEADAEIGVHAEYRWVMPMRHKGRGSPALDRKSLRSQCRSTRWDRKGERTWDEQGEPSILLWYWCSPGKPKVELQSKHCPQRGPQGQHWPGHPMACLLWWGCLREAWLTLNFSLIVFHYRNVLSFILSISAWTFTVLQGLEWIIINHFVAKIVSDLVIRGSFTLSSVLFQLAPALHFFLKIAFLLYGVTNGTRILWIQEKFLWPSPGLLHSSEDLWFLTSDNGVSKQDLSVRDGKDTCKMFGKIKRKKIRWRQWVLKA